ncbi:MAG: NifU family protein [Robiginitomaculum sp.]|nr:NifU family protein [Robiginitomaculum sp.]
MFIETEATPNPSVLKFMPGREVSPTDALDYRNIEQAEQSPLAAALFAQENVTGVFLGPDFIAITKTDDTDWQTIKPMLLGVIMDHFLSGLPVVTGSGGSTDTFEYEGETKEIVEQIKELLDTRVRPAVARDGGDIVFHHFDKDSGVVFLHMRGACAGCPSSSMTLKHGIENLLKHYVPEVSSVEQAA